MKEDLPHILVVDDDERIRTLLNRYLTSQSMVVVTAEDAAAARAYMRELLFDMAVIDIMMPGESGLNLTRYIKDSSDIPVLLLTAKAEVEERIEGLNAGADDYLPKPFEPRELILRIKAILKRTLIAPKTSPSDAENVNTYTTIGPWIYQPNQKKLLRSENHALASQFPESVSLTDNEIALMNALLKRPNTPLRRDILAQQVGMGGQDRAIDVQITRLRKKMEQDPKDPQYIQTMRGQGYLIRTQ